MREVLAMKRACLVFLATLVWLSPVVAQSPEEKKATIDYLRSLQDADDGGFREFPPKPGVGRLAPTIGSTSAALRALKYFGGEPGDKKACSLFVRRCWNQSRGGFGEVPLKDPAVIPTAVGIM